MGRNAFEAAQRLAECSAEGVRNIAKHDWDMIREVAAWAVAMSKSLDASLAPSPIISRHLPSDRYGEGMKDAAKVCEDMVVRGHAWSDEQRIAAEALLAAAETIKSKVTP